MTMTTRLACFTRKAAEEPHTRFTALMGLVFDPEGLHASFERQPGRRAPGVDGVRKVDYIFHNLYPTPLWMPQAGSRMV